MMGTASLTRETWSDLPKTSSFLNSSTVDPKEGDVYNFPSSTSNQVVHLFIRMGPSDELTSTIVKRHSSDYVRLLREAPWVEGFLNNAFELNTVSAILPYYKSINEMLHEKKFEVCDRLLSETDVSQLSDTLLVGLPRLTNIWKSNLPSWNGLYLKALQELENRKLDSKQLLMGLSQD